MSRNCWSSKFNYKSHSFRIGNASDSFPYGHSESEIKKKQGRLSFNSFQKNIRNQKIYSFLIYYIGSEKVVGVVGILLRQKLHTVRQCEFHFGIRQTYL